jgi:HEAT repeat protein
MGLLRRRREPEDEPPAELARLVEQLADADWRVRLEAARAIGALGRRARAAVPALEERITDDNGDVCNAAAEAMSRIERDL